MLMALKYKLMVVSVVMVFVKGVCVVVGSRECRRGVGGGDAVAGGGGGGVVAGGVGCDGGARFG